KKGVPLGRFATNPLTGEEVPIFAGNFVVASYGTGAVMAVPGHDQRDYDFAKKYGLEIKPVLSRSEGGEGIEENPVFDGLGWMVNSTAEGFDGLFGDDAKTAVISALEARETGHGSVEYRLKDWLLSRQRFWGTPIPMLHCDACGVVPVPYEELPVELPLDVTFSWEESGNPLARSESFLAATCPQCSGSARRETDTMDTFYDSSWYFMRFADSSNESASFDRQAVDYWMNCGVDLYIGGIEHAVMHLLYARFFTKATRDLGMNEVGEPFGRLVCQGMLNAPAPFCVVCNTEYHVDNFGGDCPNCGGGLGSRSAKMSKSLGNTVSPGEMVDRFGADTVRLFILFGANPEAGMDWSDNAVIANHKQVCSIIDAFEHGMSLEDSSCPMDSWLLARLRVNQNRWRDCMQAVSLREGVMVSHFEMLADWQWYLRRGGSDRTTAHQFLSGWAPMLAPATPHIAEEFWAALGESESASMLAIQEMEFYSGEEGDAEALAREAYLRGVIESARNLRGLAERHSDAEISGVVIQTAPSWKADLAREAVKLATEDFDFKGQGQDYLKSLAIFENESLRGEIFQTWMSLTMGSKKKRGRIHTWADGEKQLVMSGLDESEVINSAADFLTAALGVDSVIAYPVGEGEDVAGKARVAFPLEPGIAFV
ncbi:MAG: class I tRNA ligase family protein, partial [Candidatus Thermoplasmatota archaeon]|nr:class I tRNA ligase family protein [Candidatus Thermoplasmatota archaeon]